MVNIIPARLDLEVYQGADFEKVFEDIDNVLNLPDCQVFCELRYIPEADSVYTFDTTNLYINSNKIYFKIPASVSRLWNFDKIRYDIAIKNSVTNREFKLVFGTLKLNKEITKNT